MQWRDVGGSVTMPMTVKVFHAWLKKRMQRSVMTVTRHLIQYSGDYSDGGFQEVQ